MAAEVTLAQLFDIADPVNQVGVLVGGEMVRDRWNQRATVIVTDHPADDPGGERAYFVSKSLHNAWILGKAKLGTATVNDTGGAVDGQDIVIPQSQAVATVPAAADEPVAEKPVAKRASTKKGGRNGSVTTMAKKAA